MDRVAMRRVLPLIAAAIAAALMLQMHYEPQVRDAEWESSQARLKYEQLTNKAAEGPVIWDPYSIAGKLPPQSAASIALAAVGAPGAVFAFPAMVLVALVDEPVPKWVCVLGIVFFWYLAGLGIDGMRQGRAFLEGAPKGYIFLVRSLQFLSPVCFGIVLLSIISDRHGSYEGTNSVYVGVVLVWSLLGCGFVAVVL